MCYYVEKAVIILLKCAIVEDEAAIRSYLESELGKLFKLEGEIAEFELFESGDRFSRAFAEHYHYDVIFLDIEMPGTDGISVARIIRASSPDALLVFISSRDSLVFDTFEVQPFRFVRKSHFQKEAPELVSAILNRLREKNDRAFCITEPGTGDIYSFDLGSVMYVEAQRKDCRVVTASGETLIRCTMKYMEDSLSRCGFIKCHRSYLVNPAAIFLIGRQTITLTSREEIPVSRERLDSVKADFLKYTMR